MKWHTWNHKKQTNKKSTEWELQGWPKCLFAIPWNTEGAVTLMCICIEYEVCCIVKHKILRCAMFEVFSPQTAHASRSNARSFYIAANRAQDNKNMSGRAPIPWIVNPWLFKKIRPSLKKQIWIKKKFLVSFQKISRNFTNARANFGINFFCCFNWFTSKNALNLINSNQSLDEAMQNIGLNPRNIKVVLIFLDKLTTSQHK